MSKFLFISIKPEFADKIIDGTKTVELRKNKPNAKAGDFVIIYSTVPVKSVIGFGKIKGIIDDSPTFIWDNYSKYLGIDKERFDTYYQNTNRAVGIEISSVCKLTEKINLDSIRKFMPRFSPPQSYRYLSYFKALRMYELTK